jgi:prepilin-type processing-associated H-X9-DG protein
MAGDVLKWLEQHPQPDRSPLSDTERASRKSQDALIEEWLAKGTPTNAPSLSKWKLVLAYAVEYASVPGRVANSLARTCYRQLLKVLPIGAQSPATPADDEIDEPSSSRWVSTIEPPAWEPLAFRFMVIELLTTIALISVLLAILIPSINAAREAARRAQCTNNLKQLGLAVAKYESANNSLPSGSCSGALFNPPHVGSDPANYSCFVRLLAHFEETQFYNAVNIDLTSSDPANLTISGFQIGSFICPSDTGNLLEPMPATRTSDKETPGWSFNQMYPLPPGQWKQVFISYGGNAGTFAFGFSNLMPPEVLDRYNGVIYNDSRHVRIADITDGTSNTFLFGERSKKHLFTLDPEFAISDGSWNSGLWRDTFIATLYPINLAIRDGTGIPKSGHYHPTTAGGFHPGGANFTFCDASVHFIKNSIDSWTFAKKNTTYPNLYLMPDGMIFRTVHPTPPYTEPGSYLLQGAGGRYGIYQALSTRSGDEVTPSDEY